MKHDVFFYFSTILFCFFVRFIIFFFSVRLSAAQIVCFLPFSLLFSLFFARFFSFFRSQLVVPASRGHRNSDFSFQFSSFRLFCSYFLAVFLISVLSDDYFFLFFLFYFPLFCQNNLVFYFYFLSVLFFLYLPSNFIFDLFFSLYIVRLSCFFMLFVWVFWSFLVLMLFFPRCFDPVAFLFFAATLFFCPSFLFCMLFSLGTAISRLFFFFHSCFAYRSFTMFSFLSDCSLLFALFLFPFYLLFLYTFLLMSFLYENDRSLIYVL